MERRRQQEHTLNQLQWWYKTAQSINHSSSYLNQIVEIIQEFQAGTPLPEQALTIMITDFKEQLRHSHEKGGKK